MVDPLLIGLLIVCGRILASYQRTRQLELRESHLEAQLTRAKLDALRLEIQPHFLFNTLNSLAALIRANDNTAALLMLLCLSDLMRDKLDRADGQLAPLGRELELIRKYVELQRARFGERLRVQFQIERASEQCDIPVLLLQPLVENALRHGLGPRPATGHLVVGARLESSEVLHLWVSDNGVGVPAGFDLSKDSGTGLGNTRARLGHLYGSRAELSVGAAPGGGTIVEIVMPATGPAAVRLVKSGADVNAAEVVERGSRDIRAPLACRQVRCNVAHPRAIVTRRRTCRRGDNRAVLPQDRDDGGADPLRACRDERAAAREPGIEAHVVISSLAILSPSRAKRYRSSTGRSRAPCNGFWRTGRL
jgi:hypothetical protein